MTARRPVTYADVVEVPDTKVAEIIEGELVVSPRPATPHALAAVVISSVIVPEFHGEPGENGLPGGWWVLFEPELHFGADVLVPDLAAWRRERMPVLPDVAAISLAPDWVCEVISPRSEQLDRVRKMGIYAREGVRHAWLVEPLARVLEVFRLERGGAWNRVAAFAGEATVRAEPFDAVEMDTKRWWMPAQR